MRHIRAMKRAALFLGIALLTVTAMCTAVYASVAETVAEHYCGQWGMEVLEAEGHEDGDEYVVEFSCWSEEGETVGHEFRYHIGEIS